MIRYIAMISLCCFCIGLLTFNVERVETVKVNEWDLPQHEQDSIQNVQEEGWRLYADFMYQRCEEARSVIGVCKVLTHQNNIAEDYIYYGHPQKCGCYNTTLYE